MKNIVNKIIGVILYIMAAALFLYAIWALTKSVSLVDEMISSGQLSFAGNEYDIINFYMVNSGQYFAFSVLIAVAGFTIGRIAISSKDTDSFLIQAKALKEDEELDEWFEEAKSHESMKLPSSKSSKGKTRT